MYDVVLERNHTVCLHYYIYKKHFRCWFLQRGFLCKADTTKEQNKNIFAFDRAREAEPIASKKTAGLSTKSGFVTDLSKSL